MCCGQVRHSCQLRLRVRDTVPLKLPTGLTVIVEVAEVPTVTAAGDVAAIVKSVVKLN